MQILFSLNSVSAAYSVLKVNPLCHHDAGLELDFYLAPVDYPDRLQQPADTVIVKFPLQVAGFLHVVIHVLQALVIGVGELPLPHGLGLFLLQVFDFISDDADDILPERLHKFPLFLHHAVDDGHDSLVQGVLPDGRGVLAALRAVFQAVSKR